MIQLKGLIRLRPKESLLAHLAEFKTENDLSAQQIELRKLEWPFVELLVRLAANLSNCSPEQLYRLSAPEALELANYIFDKSQKQLKEWRFRRFCFFIIKPNQNLGKIQEMETYVVYYRRLKSSYGNQYFPYSKFRFYLKEMGKIF